MKITVSKVAANWYKQELSIQPKDNIQFFVRYGGVGGIVPGFSLGMQINTPEDPHATTTVEGVTFFIEQKDAWYFADKDLKIQMNHKVNEPEFSYS
ncbi:MAG TPA: HesB/YadR/YfhF family protein [Virgibacillus sp.]|nr:HesB/YadR/YfhF family protein [Virgibacillus sp.]